MSDTAQSTAALLAVRELSVSFGATRALADVDVELKAGEIHAVLGQNGSGKSTLIKVLAGYHNPGAGSRVILAGTVAPLPVSAATLRDHGVAFVHQDLGLIPSLSVVENLSLATVAIRRRGWVSWRNERIAARALVRRYGLDIAAEVAVGELPRVAQAQLAIARALAQMYSSPQAEAGKPCVLILDEPTAFLPRDQVEALLATMRQVAEEGHAVLFVTHHLEEVTACADRITILTDGRVALRGDARALTEQDLVNAIVGVSTGDPRMANDAARSANGANGAQRPDSEVAVPNETVAPAFGNGANDTGDPRAPLTVHELTGTIVDGFTLTPAYPGEIIGLTGPLGSGADEIVYLLFGAATAKAGTLSIGGREYRAADMTPRRAMRLGMVLVPSDRLRTGCVAGLTVRENLLLPRPEATLRPGPFMSLHKMAREADRVVHKYGVRPASAALLVGALSGGNQQKVLVGKWLELRPRTILLDEPTQGVDVGAREEIYEMIRAAAHSGATTLVASTDYKELVTLCDRVHVFERGRVHTTLRGSEITEASLTAASVKDESKRQQEGAQRWP